MIGSDAATLVRLAEQAFTSGRAEEARQHLRRLGPAAVKDAGALHLTALVEKKLGDLAAARTAFELALRLVPTDPAINSNFGNLLEALGEPAEALAHYDRALAAQPSFANARFARALLLGRIGREQEALAELEALARGHPTDPRYPSARGNLLRETGELASAADAYDASLQLAPHRPVPLHGRARVALELGERDAADRYLAAITNGGGAEAHLGYAQALEAEGRAAEAMAHLQQLLTLQPSWTEGHVLLSRMRWEGGDGSGFTEGLTALVRATPQNKDAWRSLISALAGADLSAEAAEAAEAAARSNDNDPDFFLLAALYLSEAGRLEEADRRYAALPDGVAGRDLHEASHRLRMGQIELAAKTIDRERERDPASIAAWALTSVVWRSTDNPAAVWLNGQEGLVRTSDLGLSNDEIASIADCLRGLHKTRAHPLGQSLRGGTQTRGRLLQRREPEIQRLRAAIEAQVDAYWRELPQEDAAHPLLRHRFRRPVVEGSWSVRLTSGGFHVAHFHTRGLVSSATYLVLPDPEVPKEGWLEIGGAPANLNLSLEPLHLVEPKPGKMALFPSYLFHGTRPFAKGERLTAAFDVIAK